MADRVEKVGANEALFRRVNEQIAGLNEAFGIVTDTVSVVCECGDGTCVEQLQLRLPEYERIRADPELFVIVRGHEAPDVESVVEQNERFDVVRKDGGKPAAIAHATDPRS